MFPYIFPQVETLYFLFPCYCLKLHFGSHVITSEIKLSLIILKRAFGLKSLLLFLTGTIMNSKIN